MATDFGRDTSCTQAGLRTGRYATGAQLVAENLFRRYTTPRGSLRGSEEEENYGIDLAERIGQDASSSDAAALQSELRAEGMKDPRIYALAIDVEEIDLDGGAVGYDITVVGDTKDGPFELTIKATSVTVELLGIKTGED